MLTINFYSGKKLSCFVDLSPELFLSLAKSKFSKIGKSVIRKVEIDDEVDSINVVVLGRLNRKNLIDFLYETITKETESALNKLGTSPSKSEYQECFSNVKSLIELCNTIRNTNIDLMQRR